MAGRIKTFGEILTQVAVVASLVFVGWEVRQSNIQARAAAFQAIGIATAEYHASLDDRSIRLFAEARYPEAVAAWSALDWDRYYRLQLSGLRMVETLLVQVEEGLLRPDAMDRLGYAIEGNPSLATPGFQCIWPDLSGFIGPSLRSLMEGALGADRFECGIDWGSLRTFEDPLVGAWRIVETRISTTDSTWVDPTPQPGLYLFTEDHLSNMLIQGTQPREPFPSNPSPEQRLAAYDPFIADAGSYLRTDSTLEVRNVIAKVPNVMNYEQTYRYRLSGDSLTLTFSGAWAPPRGEITYRLTRLARESR
jgi:hypothetical protein